MLSPGSGGVGDSLQSRRKACLLLAKRLPSTWQVMGLGEINLEEADFMMRPRTVTEVEVQLQKADPSIDVMKLVKARLSRQKYALRNMLNYI